MISHPYFQAWWEVNQLCLIQVIRHLTSEDYKKWTSHSNIHFGEKEKLESTPHKTNFNKSKYKKSDLNLVCKRQLRIPSYHIILHSLQIFKFIINKRKTKKIVRLEWVHLPRIQKRRFVWRICHWLKVHILKWAFEKTEFWWENLMTRNLVWGQLVTDTDLKTRRSCIMYLIETWIGIYSLKANYKQFIKRRWLKRSDLALVQKQLLRV